MRLHIFAKYFTLTAALKEATKIDEKFCWKTVLKMDLISRLHD